MQVNIISTVPLFRETVTGDIARELRARLLGNQKALTGPPMESRNIRACNKTESRQ